MSIEKLSELGVNGNYVFHGSPHNGIELFEPRQGKHNGALDGNPAVSATPYIEFAIFRAMINRENVPFEHSSRFGFNQEIKPEFFISSEKVLDAIKDKKGFVYVFNKKDFEPYSRDGIAHEGNMEWRSYEKIKPIDIFEVNSSNLIPTDTIKIG